MSDHAATVEQVKAIVEAADDPDRLRHQVLSRVGVEATWKPGERPDQSLDGRWRRTLAARPESVLDVLRNLHPPASVKQYGNDREWLITLADGAGKVLIKFMPGHG